MKLFRAVVVATLLLTTPASSQSPAFDLGVRDSTRAIRAFTEASRAGVSVNSLDRKAVEAVKDYHVTTKKSVDAYFAANPKERQRVDVQLRGIQPAFLEHTAWDLALATQSLVYIDPQLAFGLSRIYNVQQEVSGLTSGVLQAMYLLNPTQNLDAFLGAVAIYYGDIVMIEPKLVEMYDEILPQIDRALGESPGRKNASE